METEKPEKKKINRLIILGNGFDLSLGLKTSYKDFLYNYLRNTFINLYEVEQLPGRKISKPYEDYFLYNDGLTSWKTLTNSTLHVMKGQISGLDNYEKLSKYLIENNYLTYDFELLTKFHENSVNNNWTDIEILYYDTLILIVKKHSDSIVARENIIRVYNEKFNKLRLELVKYLKIVKAPWEVGEEQNKHHRKISQYSSQLYYDVFESNNNDIGVDESMILNFNYTNSIQKIDKFFPLNTQLNIVHIHGHSSDENSVIFGFGDELDKNYLMIESERSSEMFRYIKSPHYFQSPNYKRLNKFINQGEYEVYILGHSCGISDRTLLNQIIEIEDCKSIRIFYHERHDSTNNKLDTSIEIMKHFKDKIKMREKIKTFTKEDKMTQLVL